MVDLVVAVVFEEDEVELDFPCWVEEEEVEEEVEEENAEEEEAVVVVVEDGAVRRMEYEDETSCLRTAALLLAWCVLIS